ncbi:MAG: RICIN domain-containing protein [Clostridia bacterium]|nr:RICIN domain-containing protein [Clostridia bacterium]
MKRILAVIVALAMMISVVPVFAADGAEDITIVVDGVTIEPVDVNGNAVEPFIEDGTTYLPVRAVAEALGLSIDWDNDTRTVVIGEKGDKAELGDVINITIDGEIFIATDVNGTVVEPQNVDGSVFIPVRAIAEAFGMEVSWDQETLTVTITSSAEDDDEIGNKYYVITNVGTGKALAAVDFSQDNSAKLTTVEYDEVSDDITWRLGRMGSGIYSVSNAASGKSIDVPSASTEEGTALIIYDSNGNNNQKWEFEEVEDGVYTLKVVHSGLYMDASGDTLVQAAETGSDYQKWTLTYVKDSILLSVMSSDGWQLLDEAVQDGFERYMFGSLPACYTVANSAENYFIANDFENASAELQKEMILTTLTYTAYGQVTGDKLDQTCAAYEIVNEYVDEDYDIWRGSREKCWIYEVEMEGDVEGTVHKFTMVSNEEDSEMVQIMIEALGAFPYAVRQYVTCLIWKWGDNANNYNGGGNTIWARLNWKPSKNSVIQTLAHELGHILDSNQLEDMMIWSVAEAMDAVPISSYGSSNQAEDLAEMHRLYWTTLGRDTEEAVAEVYPNRLKVLKGLLYRADKEYFAEFADCEQFILDIKAAIDAYGDSATAAMLDMGQYYKIEDAETGLCWTIENSSMDNTARVVLEEYTGADNQKFSVEAYGGIVRFTNKNSSLPIQFNTSAMDNKALTQYGGEWAVEEYIELREVDGGFEMWSKRYDLAAVATTVGVGDDFVPFVSQGHTASVWKIEAVEKAADIEYRTISVTQGSNVKYLVLDDGLSLVDSITDEQTDAWILMPVGDAYTIVDVATGKAIDISGGSTDAGASLIAYNLSKDDNQLFYMEASGDGYLLKMKHSELYLTVNDDGTITQEERDSSKNQVFVFETLKAAEE